MKVGERMKMGFAVSGLRLAVCGLLSTTAYSYSLFSSAGIGEPVDIGDAQTRGMGGVSKFEQTKDLTFECSLLLEGIDTDGKANNIDFTLPHLRFLLPLPKSTAIDVELNGLLNLNFDLQDEWQEFAGDSVQHRVKGRGSASIAQIGMSKVWGSSTVKTVPTLGIEVGGFMVFGSSTEEWVTDFGRMDDACDTVNLKFRGTGAMGSLGLEISKFNLNASYFPASKLTSENRLPQRFRTSMIFSPTDRIRMGAGINQWHPVGHSSIGIKPMRRVSIGAEVDIGRAVLQYAPTLRAGFCTGNWYYEIYDYGVVQEKIGSVGIGVSLKSLCKIDLSFEFGKRYNSQIEEKIYRLCLSLQGKESL